MALNFVNLVHALMGQHPQAGKAVAQAHPAVASLTPQQAVTAHQLLMTHPSVQQNLTKQMGGMTFANIPGKQYEDASLTTGAQGLVPISAAIANFPNHNPYGDPQVQSSFGQQVQNVGGYPMQLQPQAPHSWQHLGGLHPMYNPQVQDQGYYYF